MSPRERNNKVANFSDSWTNYLFNEVYITNSKRGDPFRRIVVFSYIEAGRNNTQGYYEATVFFNANVK